MKIHQLRLCTALYSSSSSCRTISNNPTQPFYHSSQPRPRQCSAVDVYQCSVDASAFPMRPSALHFLNGVRRVSFVGRGVSSSDPLALLLSYLIARHTSPSCLHPPFSFHCKLISSRLYKTMVRDSVSIKDEFDRSLKGPQLSLQKTPIAHQQ